MRSTVALGIAALVTGAVAACSAKDTTAAPADASAGDATFDAASDAKPAPVCTPPANAAARCDANDPSFTFFPALVCADAGARDAGVDAGDASGDADPDAADGSVDPCSGTSLDLIFTPTACKAFADAEAKGMVATSGGPLAPTWDEPMDGDVLTADHWAIFAWTKGVMARKNAFTPLRGDAYVIEFTVDCVEILRVMLAETAWVPDPAAWAILTSQTKPVSARVVWMKYADDALSTTPVASAPITITMAH